MLVLSRRKGEEIIIGDNTIRIAVVRIEGEKVKIGIEAPADLSVHRKEVYEAIEKERNANAPT